MLSKIARYAKHAISPASRSALPLVCSRDGTLRPAGLSLGVYYGGVGERPDANNAGRVEDRVTIAEAATLLGVHPNTVRSRVKAKMYRAEKVVTERGETWMIDRNSLPTNTLPIASQQLVKPQAMELVQELLRPFVKELGEAREQLGAERARRQGAEDRVQELEAELDALREPRESSETAMESGERAEHNPARPQEALWLSPYSSSAGATRGGPSWQ
jgi:DNA-binding transcriptional regulator YhcF (GntR family)